MAKDINGVEDVYEYEPVGVGPVGGECGPGVGSGSEVFKAESEVISGVLEPAGCVALISSGAASGESAFLDASESGGDVFFLTGAKLAAGDVDTSLDVYDAHECTSVSPCLPEAAETTPPCNTEASCKPAPEPQPAIYGPPSSATFNGPGNLVSPPPAVVKKVVKKTVKCKSGFVKNRKGKCVRAKPKPKKRKGTK